MRLSLKLIASAAVLAALAAGDASARERAPRDAYPDEQQYQDQQQDQDEQQYRDEQDYQDQQRYQEQQRYEDAREYRDQQARRYQAQQERDYRDRQERDDRRVPDEAPPPPPVDQLTVTAPIDPWEKTNRKLYGVNNALDRTIIRPVAMTYRRLLPRPIRTGVRNGLDNLGEPVVFVNDTLQGHFVPAGQTATRFVLNSTVGIAGLFDVATKAGLPGHDNDFGLTLGRYHAPQGPYIFLPVLGPTTVRDGFGKLIDIVLSPLSYVGVPVAARMGMGGAQGADTRAELDPQLKALNAGATDPYSTMRSLYLQNRQSKIQGQAAAVQALPDFGDEPTPAADQPPPAPPEQVSAADDQPAAAPAPASYKHKTRTRN